MKQFRACYQFFKYPLQVWTGTLLVGSAVYSLYTCSTTTSDSALVSVFFSGLTLYIVVVAVPSLLALAVHSAGHLAMVRGSVRVPARKTAWATGVAILGIYESATHDRVMEFGVQGNYFYPNFTGSMMAFSLSYGLVAAFFIAILRDQTVMSPQSSDDVFMG